MVVYFRRHFRFAESALALILPILLGVGAGAAFCAGAELDVVGNQSFYGSVTAQPVTSEPLKLSLDDAVQRGLKNNWD